MPEWVLTYCRLLHQPTDRRKTMAGLLVLVLLILPAGATWASSVEYRLKAAFLYNFTKYIQWPTTGERTGQPFRIGVLGQDPFAGELDRLAGKSVGNRRLTVLRFPTWQPDAAACDILFVSETVEKEVDGILDRLAGLPVLTVGDTASYARKGVMITFFMADNKVRFSINLDKAKEAGLSISSRLMKLASVLE